MYAESTGQVQEFLQILRKRKWQVLVPTAFVFCLSLAAAVIIPQKYHAEGEIELRHFELGNRIGATSEALELGNAELQLVAFERIRTVLDVLQWPEYEKLKTKRRDEGGPTLVDYVKRHKKAVEVVSKYKDKTKPTSAFISVKYKNVDRDRALIFIKTLLETWSQELSTRDEQILAQERNVLQNEREKSLRDLKEAIDEKTRIEQELGIVTFTQIGTFNSGAREDPYVSEYEQVKTRKIDAEANLAGVEAKLAELDKRILDAQEYVMQDVPQARTDVAAAMLQLETQIAALQAAQRGLLPKNSVWIRLQDEIESKELELERAQKMPESSIPRQELVLNQDRFRWMNERDQLRFEQKELVAQVQTFQKRENELEPIILTRIALKGELDKAIDNIKTKQYRFTEDDKELHVKIGALTSLIRANGRPLKWSEPPNAPEEPSEPNPLIIMAIGLAGGLAIGLGSSMLVEFTKNCYRSVSDVTAVMTLPVLGVVNEIVTRQQRRSARWRGMLVIGSSTVMLLALAWFTWAYTRSPDLLPPDFLRQFEELRANFK